MGSLAYGAAVGVGKNTARQADARDKMGLADAQRAHENQLQKQRQAFDTASAATRVETDATAATTLHDRGSAEATVQREFDAGESGLERTSKEDINAADNTSLETRNTEDNEHADFRAMVGAYVSSSKTSGIRGSGWTVKTTTTPASFDMETGQQIPEQHLYMANRDGSPAMWMQQGQQMIPANGNPGDVKVEQDTVKRRQIEDALLANVGNKEIEQDFIDKYGYLPSRYFDAVTLQGDSGLMQFAQSWRTRQPAYDMSGGGGKPTAAPAPASAPAAPAAPTNAAPPPASGGALSQAAMEEIPAPTARQYDSGRTPPAEDVITLENAGKIGQSIMDWMKRPSEEMFSRKGSQ